MTAKELLAAVETPQQREGRETFEIGDTVDVHLKIKEGDKERIQVFTGAVIALKGSGSNRMFTVRRLVGTEGVERMFPLNCPSVEKIAVQKKGKVRRAKLYYLRARVGKARQVASRLIPHTAADELRPISEAVKPRQAAPKPAASAALAAGSSSSSPKPEEKAEERK